MTPMKLSAWLTESGTSDTDFARRIGVSRQTVWRYTDDGRVPKRSVMERIRTATNGAVTADDFFAGPPQSTKASSGAAT